MPFMICVLDMLTLVVVLFYLFFFIIESTHVLTSIVRACVCVSVCVCVCVPLDGLRAVCFSL